MLKFLATQGLTTNATELNARQRWRNVTPANLSSIMLRPFNPCEQILQYQVVPKRTVSRSDVMNSAVQHIVCYIIKET